MAVATRDVFSAVELERLRVFPEIDRTELIRYFTLTQANEAFVRVLAKVVTQGLPARNR